MKQRIDINERAKKNAYRWAIIGYGHVAVAHTEGIMQNHHWLSGFSTSNQKILSGDATSLEFNIGPTKGRLFQTNGLIAVEDGPTLLSQVFNKADGVIVCASTKAHYDVAKMVGVTGMDCFLEKPITFGSDDGAELIRFWQGKRGKLVVGHVLPAFPEFALLRRLLLQKGIDAVTNLTMERYVPWEDTDDEKSNSDKNGAAFDLGVHDTQLIASTATVNEVEVTSSEFRYGLAQTLDMKLQCEGAKVPFRVVVGAHREKTAFHHAYDVTFTDGTRVVFDGSKVTGIDEELEQRSVADVFGEELSIASKYFLGVRQDPSYLNPRMALAAVQILETAVEAAENTAV